MEHVHEFGGRLMGAGMAMILGHITFADAGDKIFTSFLGAFTSCMVGFFGTWFLQWVFRKMQNPKK